MDDKDRELVSQVLSAAGTAGQEGFAALVRYQVVDGIVGTLAWLLVSALAALFMRRIWRWRPNARAESEGEFGWMAKGIALLALAAFIFAAICGVEISVRQVLAPEGSAINAVLHR